MFRPVVGGTFEHDIYVEQAVIRCGLDEIVKDPDETPDEFANRILREAMEGDALFTILAALVMPDGKDASQWTPDMARETAEFFKRVTAPEDKAVLRGCFASMLSGFFVSGLASVTTSLKSSTLQEASPTPGRIAAL